MMTIIPKLGAFPKNEPIKYKKETKRGFFLVSPIYLPTNIFIFDIGSEDNIFYHITKQFYIKYIKRSIFFMIF